MKNTCLTLALTMLTFLGLSQSSLINWKQNLGGDYQDGVNKVLELTDGNIITCGYSYSDNGDIYDHFGANWYSDGWVVKMTAQGDTIWTKSLGGTFDDYANDIIETESGEYVVILTTYSNDNDVPDNAGSSDYWIVKLDATGNIIWSKTFGGSSTDKPYGIYETAGGNYIIGGYSYSSSSQVSSPPNGDVSAPLGGDDFWLIKLDSNGNLLWDKSIGGTSTDDLFGMAATLDGNLIAIGFTWSTDGDVPANNGTTDYLVTKIDTSGNLLWAQNYGGSDWDYGYSIAATSDGGYIAIGASYSNDIDVSNHYGSYDAWVVKLDGNGVLEWNKSYGGTGYDAGYAIIENSALGYVFSGATDSQDNDVSNPLGSDDAWVVHVDTLSNIVWEETLGGDTIDRGYSLIQLQNNTYVMGGLTKSNNNDINGTLHGSLGHEDYWVLNLKCQPSYTPSICLVTVDSSSTKNVVVWEKPSIIGIDSFRVYREITGTYVYIGSVHYDSLSTYTDNSAGINPNTTSYRYKISSLDTCGYESDLGAFHETIHLTTSAGTGNDINLVWDDYEGIIITKYYILRDSTGIGNYEIIDSVGSTNFTYTDQSPPNVTNIDYVIEIVPPSVCVATKASNYSSSRSNSARQTTAPSSNAPVANFASNFTSVTEGSSIDFADQSTNTPTSWAWTFTGGSPFISSDQNPTNIIYSTTGTYDVTLVATNADGSGTLTKTGYITVGPTGIDNFGLTSGIHIYPNPTSGLFVLKLDNNSSEIVRVNIYNSLGQIVVSKTYNTKGKLTKELNLTQFGAGIYNIEINVDGQSVSKRLVVQ